MHPSILKLTPLDDEALQGQIKELNRQLESHNRKSESIKEIVSDILFMRYALFVLSLIRDGDKRAKNFIHKSSVKTRVLSNATMNFWELVVPRSRLISDHIDDDCNDDCDDDHYVSNSYYVSLNEILYQLGDRKSREYRVISEMVCKYILIEIVDCNGEIYYSYDALSAVKKYAFGNNHELAIGCDFYDIRQKERRNNGDKRDGDHDDNRHSIGASSHSESGRTICVDMYIIMLYIIASLVRMATGIDLICLLDSSGRMPGRVRKAIKN